MATIIGSGLESYLRRQARERAMNLMAEAEEKARRILEQASTEAEHVGQEIRAKAQKEIAEQRKRSLAQANLAAKQTLIRRREELLEHLWQEAVSRLQHLDDRAQRLVITERLIEDAIAQLGGGPVAIQINEQDRDLLDEQTIGVLRQHLADKVGLKDLIVSQEAASIWGGVIVHRLDTNQLVDNSFNYRLALARATLRDTIYQLLTPDHDSFS